MIMMMMLLFCQESVDVSFIQLSDCKYQ